MTRPATSVLFVCVRNSARSQLAEAVLRHRLGDQIRVASAGLEPGELHPLTIRVLEEAGITHENPTTDSVFERFARGELYRWVVTVCSESQGQRCPIFPGIAERIHWDIADPASAEGSDEEKMEAFRTALREVREHVDGLIENQLELD